MFLFKDYSTGKKSITITGMIVTFLLSVASIGINFYLMIQRFEPFPAMSMTCLAFFAIFAGLYWNKRFRASTSGIELISDSEVQNGIGTNSHHVE